MQPDALRTLLRERELPIARSAVREGGAPWRRLTETYDDAMRALAIPALGPDQALLATGSYGRRELTRHTELDLLLLTPGDASNTVHAVLAPLWDAGLLARYEVRAADQPMISRDSIDELIMLPDARLICGASSVFERFVRARQDLVERRRSALHAELRRRQTARVAAEPWQTQEPDVVTSRGGLNAFLALHWARLADQIAGGLHAPSLADPSIPLAAEYEVLSGPKPRSTS